MKSIKKLFAMLLVVVMTIGLSVSVLAVEPTPGSGSITITNAVPGQKYTVYRIFDLASYNPSDDAYVYTVNPVWKEFVALDSISGSSGYVSVDSKTGYVSWAKKNPSGANEGMEEFAEAALAWAKEKGVKGTAEATAPKAVGNEETVKLTISGLDLGYYLVDSNVGTICSLDTTTPDVNITDKNKQPTVEKKVQEGSEWEDSNDAQIGDTVNFKVTITAQKGAQNYILHDKMEDGLDFVEGSVKVYRTSIQDDNIVAEDNYDVITTTNDGCDFEVEFSKEFCDSITEETAIIVTYSAVLNEKVKMTEGEDNTVHLTYGEKNDLETLPDETVTYAYRFQIIKTNSTSTDGNYTLLSGAEFELYTEPTGGTPIQFIKLDAPEGTTATAVYRVATKEEIENDEVVKTTTIEAGYPIIQGLDKKSYYLEETKAPNGYNPVSGRTEVKITGDNLAGSGAIDSATNMFNSSIEGGVWVKNSKGNELPSTGGIGTTIFYVIGSLLVIAAGASLVIINRRRRAAEK